MAKSVITTIGIKKMLEARAGIQPLDKITGMAFGDGAVTGEEIAAPDPDSPQLLNELYRQEIDKYEVISDTRIRYICTLKDDTLAGKQINEIGLYDAAGDLVAIKNFMNKGKDADIEIAFEVDDTFYQEEKGAGA